MGIQEKVAQYVNETRRMGIMVLPPDINESFTDFTVVGNSIRFGLSAIKNVGTNVIECIEKERKKGGKFENFIDFCQRVDSSVLNKKTLESLIKSGTFDSLGQSRKYLLENYEKIIEETLKIKKDRDIGQFSLFDFNGGGGEKMLLDGVYKTEEQFEEFSKKELLNFEKEMLGLYISGHPLFEYEDSLSRLTPIEALSSIEDKANIGVGGIITRVKIIFTKKGQQMCFAVIEDISGSVEVIVFPSVLDKYREVISEEKIVKIKGKLDKKEDQIKIIANEIEELKKNKRIDKNQEELIDNNNNNNKVIFAVRKRDMDKNFINMFYDILKKYPGSDEVEFKVTGENGKDIERIYKLPFSCRIDLNQSLKENLREVFSDKIKLDRV